MDQILLVKGPFDHDVIFDMLTRYGKFPLRVLACSSKLLGSDRTDMMPLPTALRRDKGNVKKSLGLRLEMDINRVNEDTTLYSKIDPAFLPVHPFKEKVAPSEVPCGCGCGLCYVLCCAGQLRIFTFVLKWIREIESFEVRRDPDITWSNTLYLFPETVSIKNPPSSPSLALYFRLKDDDTDPFEPSLKVHINHPSDQSASLMLMSKCISECLWEKRR